MHAKKLVYADPMGYWTEERELAEEADCYRCGNNEETRKNKSTKSGTWKYNGRTENHTRSSYRGREVPVLQKGINTPVSMKDLRNLVAYLHY